LWSVFRQSVARLQRQGASVSSPADANAASGIGDPKGATLDTLRAAYRTKLREFAARTARAGIPLLVTAFPSHLALRNPASTDYGWFASMIATESLAFLDPLPVLMHSALGERGLYLLPHDAHASAAGYRLLAHALAARVLSSPVRDRVCRSR
ncbi:MAG TPA: hypothetical protein VE869_15490, partial [Gemmatimonas sp.]|nr:hypothetical protein [Gemmatimonas sp.]